MLRGVKMQSSCESGRRGKWILELVVMSAPEDAGGRGIMPRKMVPKLLWNTGQLWMVEV